MTFFLFLLACSAQGGSSPPELQATVTPTKRPLAIRTPLEAPTEIYQPAVEGVLFVGENGKLEPVVGVKLYLAELLVDDGGEAVTATFDRVDSPQAVTSDEGEFVFQDVPPGRYALALDMIRQAYLLKEPNSDGPLIVTVDGEEPTYLGELHYSSLPVR